MSTPPVLESPDPGSAAAGPSAPAPPVVALPRAAVLALAPDAASARAGERLAGPGTWSELGAAGDTLWGACRGSGAKPYRVVVLARADHASTCTCPSRKFPCKHALGLMFLASGTPEALATQAAPPPWVREWLDRRAARAADAATRAARPASAATPRTQARRDAKVDAGVAELGRWLIDLAHGGLGAAQVQPASWWEATAARMVDAQAPGLADAVREMGRIAAGGGGADWAALLTDRLGRLYLLCQGWAHRERLPAGLAEALRDRIGFTQPTAAVLAGEHWSGPVDVLGDRVFHAGKLQGRRQWLRLAGSGQTATLVSYAPANQAVAPPTLPVLTRVHADLAAYPGRRPTRMALAATTGDAVPLTSLATSEPAGPAEPGDPRSEPGSAAGGPPRPGGSPGSGGGPRRGEASGAAGAAATWRSALVEVAATLAADPWADPIALVVRRLTVLPPLPRPGAAPGPAGRAGAEGTETRWMLRDEAGEALPLTDDSGEQWGWWLLAVGGGRPLDVAAEWDGFALAPLSAMPSPGRPAASGPVLAPPAAGGASAAARPAPGWADLVDTAVIGTARRAVAPIPALEVASGPAPGADGGPTPADDSRIGPAVLLLRTTALMACARRAGQLAADASGRGAPAPVPTDHAAVPPPEVCRLLEQVLAAPDPEAADEMLGLLAAGGWRVPEELLPALLSRGHRDVAIRGSLSRVLGERGRWLAALHPDGRWAAGTDLAGWPTAGAAERRTLVQQLRHTDPAAAVALLRGAAGGPPFAPFDTASGAERLAFCEALRVGLGPWDAELLEHALDDRRADVRQAAAAVALALPGSALEARAAARTESMLTVRRRLGRRPRLELTPPAECTEQMRRDGISGGGPSTHPVAVRGRLLEAELARVDPAVWTRRTGLSPEEFLTAEVSIVGDSQDHARRLRAGLLPAVLRHRDPAWVLALMPLMKPPDHARLVACLPEPARTDALVLGLNAAASRRDDRGAGQGPDGSRQVSTLRAARLLLVVPGPWPAPFSRAALAVLTELVTNGAHGPVGVHRARELLARASWRLHLDVDLGALDNRPGPGSADPHTGAPRTTAAQTTDPDAAGAAVVAPDFVAEHARLIAVLDLRRRLRAALTSPPPVGARPPGPARPAQEGRS